MDEKCPRADYVIVKDGLIKEVGKGPVTIPPQNHDSVVDLGGKTVLPGVYRLPHASHELLCAKRSGRWTLQA